MKLGQGSAHSCPHSRIFLLHSEKEKNKFPLSLYTCPHHLASVCLYASPSSAASVVSWDKPASFSSQSVPLLQLQPARQGRSLIAIDRHADICSVEGVGGAQSGGLQRVERSGLFLSPWHVLLVLLNPTAPVGQSRPPARTRSSSLGPR